MDKLIHYTARSIAGLIYRGTWNQTQIYQLMEEHGLEEKLGRVEEILEDMSAADEYHRNVR